MPRIQSHSRVERPVPGVRRLASQDQDFLDALASKDGKPLPTGRPAPVSTGTSGSSHDFEGGITPPLKKGVKPESVVAAFGATGYLENRDFVVVESPSSTIDTNVGGTSGQFIDSAALPSTGQLPATGGDPGFVLAGDTAQDHPDLQGLVDVRTLLASIDASMGQPVGQLADNVVSPPDVVSLPDVVPSPDVVSPPDVEVPPADSSLEFETADDATENRAAMQEAGAAKALLAGSSVDAGESPSRFVDEATLPLDADPPPMDGNPEFPVANDATASLAGIIEVEDVKVPAKLPMFPNASNALLGLPTASASQSVTWSRVFGQHLIANEYLSVVDVVRGEQGESEALWASVDGHEGRLKVGGTFPSILPAAQPDQASDAQAVEIPRLRPAMENDTDGDHSRAVQDEPLAALENALASDPRWNRRALKLTHDPVGACTAWVRDFGLHESEMQALAASLQHQAALQGVPLGRIVINGREFWRARD